MSNVNFDSLLKEIGEFGRFQKLSITSLSIVQIFLAFANFGFVFFGYTPTDFQCIDPILNTTGCVAQCNYYASNDGYTSYATEVCRMVFRLIDFPFSGGLFARINTSLESHRLLIWEVYLLEDLLAVP